MKLYLIFLFVMVLQAFAHLEGEHEEGHMSEKRPSRTLTNFDIITSHKHVKRTFSTNKRSFEVRDMVQPYPDHVVLELESFDTTFVFDLMINDDLLHSDFRIQVFDADSSRFATPHHRFYKGTVTSPLGSGWARLTLLGSPKNGDPLVFQGAFVIGEEMYEVKKTDVFKTMNTEVDKEIKGKHDRKRLDHDDVDMVIYKRSDLMVHDPEAEVCGVTNEHHTGHFPDHDHFVSHSSPVEDPLGAFGKEKRVASGCPTTTKTLYMGIYADCTYTAKNTDSTGATNMILHDWNLISALYETTFNVNLGILDIKIRSTCGATPADDNGGTLDWNVDCSTLTISNRLSAFSNWRGKQSNEAGLWHLMSTCNTGTTIGIAWMNQLCQTSTFSQTSSGTTSYVSGVGVTTAVDDEWLVAAHEIGHNFGSQHDCTSGCTKGDTSCNNCAPTCDCNAQFIMNPSNQIATHTFSQPSQTIICSRSSTTGTCFAQPGSKPVKNINVCGNGILEPPAEQCDCGGTTKCANDSCCYSNCTLKPGAVCADANSACCYHCHINTANSTVCRAVDGECDVAEYCDGVSALCPEDKFKDAQTPCSSVTDGYCASGKCTNRVQQCITAGVLNNLPEYNQDCLGSCQLFCQSQLEGCRYFPGNFLNGTKCDNGGTCQNGICSTGDVIGTIVDFVQKNLVLVIVGASVLGLLILGFLLWGCRKANRKDIKLGKSMANFANRLTGRRRPPPNDNPSGPPPSNRGAPGRTSQQGDPRRQSQQDPRRQSQQPQQQQPQRQPGGSNRNSANLSPNQGQRGQRPPSMVGDFVAGGHLQSTIPEHPPDYNDIALQVRCPICQRMFPNERAVAQHLDTEHA